VLFQRDLGIDHVETFGPGSAFLIPAGFKGSWETVETLRKYYAIFEPGR
jgi:uncharacterized protein